ncbi:hypothetical protein BV25DRAFT_1912186 [Artomyces pyxidatus]|uniref:Uncharacterized protein n=1 Tax=Artomyces pyxidatus TaxID=48021 RepID=A0ACB8TEI5_9AGAM|nr:hypothetical protein BV25DRAFT_1912186 [Artomyces pyxidatus]
MVNWNGVNNTANVVSLLDAGVTLVGGICESFKLFADPETELESGKKWLAKSETLLSDIEKADPADVAELEKRMVKTLDELEEFYEQCQRRLRKLELHFCESSVMGRYNRWSDEQANLRHLVEAIRGFHVDMLRTSVCLDGIVVARKSRCSKATLHAIPEPPTSPARSVYYDAESGSLDAYSMDTIEEGLGLGSRDHVMHSTGGIRAF